MSHITSYIIHVPFESTVVGDHTTQDMDPSSAIYNTTVFSYQAPSSAPSRSDYATGETLNSSGSDSGDLNRTFEILIKISGVIDVLFVRRYLGIFTHDHRNERNVTQTKDIGG